MIPILKIILENFLSRLDENIKTYLSIVFNSALHLQTIIEDALDLSRIENNKFQIFREEFNIREAVSDVCKIMDFQAL
jgi:signal transduction histidine kinase